MFKKQADELNNTKSEKIEQKDSSEYEIQELSNQLSELKQSSVDLEKTLNDKRLNFSSQIEKIYDLQNLRSVSEERKKLD